MPDYGLATLLPPVVIEKSLKKRPEEREAMKSASIAKEKSPRNNPTLSKFFRLFLDGERSFSMTPCFETLLPTSFMDL